MKVFHFLAIGGAVLTLVLGATRVAADYETHPDLAPENRCAGLANPYDCQPLVWDLPAATSVGETAAAAPLPDFPDFPGGKTDRPPPLYSDGTNGYELPGAGRAPLCPDPDDPTSTKADPNRVPYWRDTGTTEHDAEVYAVDCRRGTRAYYGPWYVGSDASVFDKLAYKVLVFENSSRLAGAGYEMNVSAEIYDHVGSHHGTCYVSTNPCADATNPDASSTQCDQFRQIADACSDDPGSTQCCRADDPRASQCPLQQPYGFVAFRSTTARQGRYTMDLPPGRAFAVVEDPMWLCQQHVVSEEPTYDGGRRNFRNQKGGAVGEMVIQLFTVAATSAEYKPVSMSFDFVASAATTLVPPFTMAPQETVWYAPFDLAIGMLTMHSHQKMVKGTIDVVPAPPARLSATRPGCGGPTNGLPNPHVYENWSYFEPEICEYWREDDGPLILRKGEAIRAECMINNGVTPTSAISDPELRRAVETSPVGQELYGRQDPSAYRVRYGCERVTGVPPGAPADHAKDCTPAPGGGPSDDCPKPVYTGNCVPANVVFANTGEDSMCIPVIMYWPLDRLLNADGSLNDDAMEELQSGQVNEVGTPGRVWKSPSDGGSCDDAAGSTGAGIDDPNTITPYKAHDCRGGL